MRQLAERLGVHLAPDDELRELHRTHRFDDDPAALQRLADELGVNLDEQQSPGGRLGQCRDWADERAPIAPNS